MLNCLYKGQRINSIDIMEEASYKHRKEIKTAGCKKELLCEDCGLPVILKAGQVRQAHFAHWKGFNELCPYQDYTSKETEAHKKCKKLIYNMIRQSYADELVQVEFAAIPTRRSDVYIEFNTGEKLAIDIHRGSISTAKWDNKHLDYKNEGIIDLWFILGQPYERKERNMPFFHQIMLNESLNNIAVFINPNTETVTLLKNMIYIEQTGKKEHSKIFKKEYSLDDIKILPTGKIECDFDELYKQEMKSYVDMFRSQINDAIVKEMSFDPSWVQISFDTERNSIDDTTLSTAEDENNLKIRATNEKYLRVHLDLITAGTNQNFHIEKIANKILDEQCYRLFVNMGETMKVTNNRCGYEAYIAVMKRYKRIKKK